MKLPPIYYTALIAVVSAIALHEFYTMYGVRDILKYAGVALGFLIILEAHQGGPTNAVFASLMAIALLRLFIKPDPASSLAEMAPVVFGLIYIPGLLGYQMPLMREAPELILYLYGSVWCGDAFAYYIGKGIGKRKLYEAISPNKTVAGGLGSLLGGAVGALVIKALFLPGISVSAAALTGGAIGAATILGDLVESMLKRDAGVKDSSSLIPGHGGVLDKVDGSIFAGPALVWMLAAFNIMR